MTVPIKPDGEAPMASPIGGRPFEWRALEEAAAFEKWFEAADATSQDRAAPARGAEPADTARPEPAPVREAPVPAQTRRGWARDVVGSDPGPAQATATAPRPAASHETGALAPPVVGAAIRRAQAAAVDGANGRAPTSDSASPRWSRLSLTAVLNDEKVRVHLRDYRLSQAEIEVLEHELRADLRRLGYRLALFVVNGEHRHGD